MAWKRYKGPDGAEFTADELTGVSMGLEPLDKDAVDLSGYPLAPKYDIHKGGSVKAASDKKDG